MLVLGSLGFGAPLVLVALLALPILWFLLRATPPAPVTRRFPGVVLLLGLEDRDAEPDRTPWWLLLLRLGALAAMILGFAGPVLHPEASGEAGDLPLLVVLENGWGAAPDWKARLEVADAALEAAGRAGRLAAVLPTAGEGRARFAVPGLLREHLAGLAPRPWEVDPGGAVARLPEGPAEVLWISDGLAHEGRAELLRALEALGPLRVVEPPRARLALRPPIYREGLIEMEALRARPGAAQSIAVSALGPDPVGVERELARAELRFEEGATEARARLSLPPELRNRIGRFAIEGEASAAAVSLADDSLRRRRVGLFGSAGAREGLELLSPLHYLDKALSPSTELLKGDIAGMIRAGADTIILADVASLPEAEHRALAEWVAQGGLLLRFAGPRLAAADEGRGVEDALLPVRLRAGGRVVGGAMSWGTPQALAPFGADSPFYGLSIPPDVTVSAQVLAEPGPELAARTIASLADGTPLVTRKALGEGQVVLFHVTANAEWSSLPLSGLFVSMLERLAVSTRPRRPDAGELVGTTWAPVKLLDGFGALAPAGTMAPVAGEALAGRAGPDLPPGLYTEGADGARSLAVNVFGPDTPLAGARWPARIVPIWGEERAARDVAGWFWLAALLALALDLVASLALSGRLARGRRAQASGLLPGGMLLAGLLAGLLTGSAALLPTDLWAQAAASGQPARDMPDALVSAAAQVTLAHVLTGDGEVDAIARAGLTGLGDELFRRTSVEPGTPVGVDLERDELAVYPLLYWPVTASQPLPSAAAYERLNAYLRAGGMVLFDTRDAQVAGYGSALTPEARRLRLLAAPLEVPPLEPLPEDHVLTRAFYLLTAFPGRYRQGKVWVEAAPPDAERAPGMPFRNLNDGVTPVVIGSNDWAAAWAVRADGRYMFPVGRGSAGARQREMAYRFGVNLVMHVLTGNYKSDQVHVPALLERLGQ